MDFKALPKIELHAHLTGSISRHTLHEIWVRKRNLGQTTIENPLTVLPEGKHDFDLEAFFPLFSSYIYNLLTDEPSIRHATKSVLKDFLADGVVYLELRTTPRHTGELTPESLISVIIDTIRIFEKAHPGLHTKLILSVDRRHDLPTAERILRIALKNRPAVVGLDLCGDPNAKINGDISIFTPVFRRAGSEGLSVTVHFAEAEASASRAELEVLLSWNPKRLGHVIWEDEQTKQEIADRGLCLELCLSCNVKAGMIKGSFESHHFGAWRNVRGPVLSLGTDDVGVFGSASSNEYRLVAEHFNMDRIQICALAREGIEAIFGDDEEKKRLREIMWS